MFTDAPDQPGSGAPQHNRQQPARRGSALASYLHHCLWINIAIRPHRLTRETGSIQQLFFRAMNALGLSILSLSIVPTLCVGMQPGTLRVPSTAGRGASMERFHAIDLDRSHALRGNVARDAPRPFQRRTQSVHGGVPTQSVGTIGVISAETDEPASQRRRPGTLANATQGLKSRLLLQSPERRLPAAMTTLRFEQPATFTKCARLNRPARSAVVCLQHTSAWHSHAQRRTFRCSIT